MALSTQDDQLVFAFGILGNILSFLVYLAPLPTFYKIWKTKSTQGFECIPYVVALFSASLTMYYGFLKSNGFLLITINSIGILIESLYLLLFILYATREVKIHTAKLLILFNVGVLGIIIFSTMMFSEGGDRRKIVGWTCSVFSVCVFAAPLSIMRLVIRTKSIDYMPFPLSFFLTLCAIMWFFYGLLSKDYFVAVPNVLGFALGIVQMVLYHMYKNKSKQAAIHPVGKADLEMKQQQEAEDEVENIFEKEQSIKAVVEDFNALVIIVDEEKARDVTQLSLNLESI